MKVGLNDISKIYLGTNEVSKIYIGTTQVYPEIDYSLEYLTFVITSAGTIGWKNVGGIGVKTIQYSINNGAWTSLSSPSTTNTANYIEGLQIGDKVRIKGTNNTYATSQKIYAGFEGGTAKYNIYGNIMSVIAGDNFQNATSFTGTYNVCSMFKKSGAVDAGNLILPVLNLTEGCYRALFSLAPYLTVAPKTLPATSLAKYCYWYMFESCPITTAPEMPYDGVVPENGYGHMFVSCASLNYIKCLATGVSAASATEGWVKSVAASGTFIKNANMSSWTSGENGIPSGWTVVDYVEPQPDYSEMPLTFEIGSSGNIFMVGSKTLEYSVDNGTTWGTLDSEHSVPVDSGDIVQLRGNTNSYGSSDHLSATATISKVYGNIMSIYNANNFTNATTITTAIGALFYGMSTIEDCSNLKLPATTLVSWCYSFMFYGCTSLTTAPELPATTLVDNCYSYMFRGCTSLTTAPELPATTLSPNCYQYMFYGCTSLTTAPELPATTLVDNCYSYMFYGCTNLNYVKCLATNITAWGSRYMWLRMVSSTGTFIKNSAMSSWTSGENGIPANWTVQDAS